MQKTLKQIYEEHTGKVSDKWALYLDELNRLFAPYRDQPVRILEIGIHNGGSLEIWGKYFLKAEKILGCDIDSKCENLRYDDDRIEIVVGDANSNNSESDILQQAQAFDIIIDDGSHKSSDIVRSFARYFPHLSEGGVYIVEDLHASYWKDFEGGLHNPLSAMAFFKRLADVVNYEHWRNNKPRWSLFSVFAESYRTEFEEPELANIHSIEFVNSLCTVKKMPPGKNILGSRIIVGTDESVSSGLKKLCGTEINNIEIDVKNDKHLDVFELIANLAEKEQTVQVLSKNLAEKDQTVQALSKNLTEKDQTVQALKAQITEINNSKAWKFAIFLRKIRVRLLPPGSQREKLMRWLYTSLS